MGVALLLTLVAAAADAPPGAEFAAATPAFLPERFFVGRTEGAGTLKVVLKGAQAVRVHGSGRIEGDTLVLDQVVERPEEKPERRQWRIKKLVSGGYTGTLSDAKGPIQGDVSGNRLHLKYRLAKGNVDVEQWVYLQPGGRVAQNRLVLRRFGLHVGSMDEVIRRVD